MARYKTGNSVKDRKNRACNGWKNWDTWAVGVVMSNDRKAYDYVRKNKSRLLRMKKEDKLKAIERNSSIGLMGASKRNVDYKQLNRQLEDME